MKTLLFYDIETSGLNPAFDQVLTFACIRTDLELNEIERTAITICLRSDIVPSPKAILTHGLTFDELETGVSEYQAALQIHKILNTPGTISLGYNSLGFDDEFLRFLFYRNLLDPYTHQYGKGCSRMDILPITVLFKIFYPKVLQWPKIDGKSSLKLELISRENNFQISGKAHEAMSDVEAVIELAKRFFQQKKIWNYCLGFFNKPKDEIRINSIKKDFQVGNMQFRICLMLSIAFGADKNYMSPVIHIGQSMPYKNQTLWMRLDLEDTLYLNSKADLKDTFVIRKRAADELIVLPPLERFWRKMSPEVIELVKCNLDHILQQQSRFFEFIKYHREYKYPFIPGLDPDAALYQDDFFTSQEKKESNTFHKSLKKSDYDHKPNKILERIKSSRIKTLAKRILFRNFKHENLPVKDVENSLGLNRLRSSSKKDQIIGYKNDIKFNCQEGLQELQELENETVNLEKEKRKMFFQIKEYIKNL